MIDNIDISEIASRDNCYIGRHDIYGHKLCTGNLIRFEGLSSDTGLNGVHTDVIRWNPIKCGFQPFVFYNGIVNIELIS